MTIKDVSGVGLRPSSIPTKLLAETLSMSYRLSKTGMVNDKEAELRGLFLNVPMTGHINPTLELVRTLVERGDEVFYYCTEQFRRKIETSGATFRAYNLDIPEINPASEPSAFELGLHFLDMSLAVLGCHLDEWRLMGIDYVITDSCLIAGKIAAAELEVPGVTSTTTFALVPEMFFKNIKIADLIHHLPWPPRLWYQWWRAKFELRRAYGMTLSLFDTITCPQPLNLVYTSQYFQPLVDHLDQSSHRFFGPMLRIEPDSDGFPFEELLGKKVIYVSLGTTYNAKPQFFKRCIEALHDLHDAVIILSVGNNIAIEELHIPEKGFIVQKTVPQLEVLRHADLFITHGGMNSVNEAMYFGVPVMVCPQQQEQNLVGNRVAELGAGLNLQVKEPDPKILRQLVATVLADQAYKRAARVIGDSFRQAGGAPAGVEAIHQYIKSYALGEFRTPSRGHSMKSVSESS